MKITFIQPYHKTNVKLFGKVYMSQLTLPLLAALTPKDIEVKIVDENVEPIDFNEPTDLVAITMLTPMAPRAYEIATLFRQRGVKVVLGGVHATHMPEEAAKYADAVVIGEAENVWTQLLADFKNGQLKKFYSSDIKPDLKGLPIPHHNLVKSEFYVDVPKVETSRGCPYRCSFCSTTAMFGNRMRYRPISEVINEIKALKARFVFFTDNNIVGNPRYAKEFFKALIPLKIRWISQGSLNIARDLELLKLAAKSGCVGILVGIESLVQEALAAMGKRVNKVSQYAREIKRIHQHGIGLIGCFVFGFDQEDASVFKKTVDFVRKLNIEVPQFTLLTPYPGTALRTTLEKAGRILHNQWEKYDVSHVVFRPEKMTPEQLLQSYRQACRKVYSYWSILKRTVWALPYLRSLYKFSVFWQINLVYRRLFYASLDD
jgi:radical SAM superfamily enzyme YgiQ (UPF0313 family)